MKLIRFNKLSVLKRIDPMLLHSFFQRFEDEFHREGLALPPPNSPPEQYFGAVANLLNHPDKLPNALNEALFAIEDVASPPGQEFVEQLPEWPELARTLAADSTAEEIALQLWLRYPNVLVRASNTHRLKRLTAFEHAGRTPKFRPSEGREERESTIRLQSPDAAHRLHFGAETLNPLRSGLDSWFALNHRGDGTTRIELYPLDGEFWFLIRHGDRYSRAPAVRSHTTEILHFRPERDDVVVFSPELDEIRINARTKGERDLYIRQFGLHLRGSEEYFARLPTYTLEPLRSLGADALDASQFQEIASIQLRELEVQFEQHKTITRCPECLFSMAERLGEPSPVPKEGELCRAVFRFEFRGSSKPRCVEIRLPNTLKLGRRCDGRLVQTVFSVLGFRRGCGGGEGPGR